MTAKTCLITQANGKTCGRTAVARTAAGPVCGIHARAEERRGGEVTPFPTEKTFVSRTASLWVKVTPYDDYVAASEFAGGANVAYRRFTGETAYADAQRWAGFRVNPVPLSEDPRPRDKSGYLYVHAHGMDWRVTECCEAPTTYTGDGDHVCKACYREVDTAYGDLPVLGDAEPNPQGPVFVTLPTAGQATKVIWKNEDFINGESFGPMVVAREGQAYALGQQPWVARSKAVAEAERLGVEFVEA